APARFRAARWASPRAPAHVRPRSCRHYKRTLEACHRSLVSCYVSLWDQDGCGHLRAHLLVAGKSQTQGKTPAESFHGATTPRPPVSPHWRGMIQAGSSPHSTASSTMGVPEARLPCASRSENGWPPPWHHRRGGSPV